MKHFLLKKFILLLTIVCSIQCLGQNNLPNIQHYEGGGIRFLSLDLLDENTCVLRQNIRMALPSGNEEVIDTMRYRIYQDKIKFKNLSKDHKYQKQHCVDYNAMCFYPTSTILINGQTIYLNDTLTTNNYVVAESDGFFYRFPSRFSASLFNQNMLLYLKVKGTYIAVLTNQCTNMISKDWSHWWFCRDTYPNDSIPLLKGKCFSYKQDSILFMDDVNGIYIQHGKSHPISFQYTKSAPYVILQYDSIAYADSMLYVAGSLINAIVVQNRASAPKYVAIDYFRYLQEPTGNMYILVYLDTNEESLDKKEIVNTCQQYYLPINYSNQIVDSSTKK